MSDESFSAMYAFTGSWHYGPTVAEYYAGLHLEPASSTTTYARLTVLYTYTATGYLQQLSNALYPSQVFWTGNSEDAFGQVASENYGGGLISSTIAHSDPLGRITGISSTSGSTTLQGLSYQWDALGNLTSRSDSTTANGNQSEQFQYDLLNRLTSAQVTDSGGVQPAVTYGYDALGDITSKSDTGTYSYGGGAGPHAVTSISGAAGVSYAYDADGNMTNRNGTTITWNSLNLPTQITESSSNSSSFAYAPDKHRYYQSAEINGVAETTVYVGGYEAVTTGGVTTYRHHLMADGREVAEIDLSNSGSSVTEKVSYVLTDHLGSTDVVETTDGNNNVLGTAYMSFSAWGGRREPGTWLPPVGATETQADHAANRYGFTHQEMLDNVGLVHMNGRVYDPSLGRFLSVDPVFEFPTNTQSLNPYSYVLNNPLSMTDPTGYAISCIHTGQSTTCSGSIEVTGSHIAQQVSAT
ncbi:MAG: RHS repeat-associated core domain-containing protein, partial [Gammaproteobacteria bacterium]